MKQINSLTYEGIVKLKLIDEKSKRVKKSLSLHNEGTDTLFYFLCNCLANKWYSDYSPVAIDASLIEYTEDTLINNSALAYRVILSSQNVLKNITEEYTKSNNTTGILNYSYVTKFTAIIPYSIILNADSPIRCLQLHAKLSQSDKFNSLLAYINLSEPITVKQGEALLIEWNLGFQNPSNN